MADYDDELEAARRRAKHQRRKGSVADLVQAAIADGVTDPAQIVKRVAAEREFPEWIQRLPEDELLSLLDLWQPIKTAIREAQRV